MSVEQLQPRRPRQVLSGARRLLTAGERTAQLARDAANLTANYYRGLIDLGRSYAEVVADDLLGKTPGNRATRAPRKRRPASEG